MRADGDQRRRSSPGTGATTPRSARRREHDFDEAALKPYLQLDSMLAAAFDVAGRLFGLSFHPVEAALYHPDARAWEVRRGDRHMGVFIGDYFARPSKRSGAWCSSFRGQSKLDGEVRPIARQRLQLRQGAGGRAEPADLRRRAHALPRDGPRAARAALGRDLRVRLRHQRWRATSSSCRASSTSTGSRRPRCSRRTRATPATGAPMPRELMDRRDRRAQLRPGLRHGRVPRLGAGRPRLPRRAGAGRPDGGAGGDARRGSACRRRS